MNRLILLCSLLAVITGCSRYERAEYVPVYGETWVDPPFERRLDAAYEDLTDAFRSAYPVLQTEVCSPGESEALAAQLAGLCEVSDACLESVVSRANNYTASTFQHHDPETQLDLLELRAVSLRHVETVLVPGLTRAEMEEVVIAACEQSPTVKLLEDETFPDYFGTTTRDEQCRLDWTFTESSIDTLRRALLDSRSQTACTESPDR